MSSKRKQADDPGQYLPLLARSAADRARARSKPLTRSAALAEAPWDPSMPPAWEGAFRAAYADRLEVRKLASPAKPSGKARGAGGETELVRIQVLVTAAEREQHTATAKAAGISLSTWARRRLAT